MLGIMIKMMGTEALQKLILKVLELLVKRTDNTIDDKIVKVDDTD